MFTTNDAVISQSNSIRVAIRPVFAGTVPFLGLGPGVPPSLPLCPGIFFSKYAFVNMSTKQTSYLFYYLGRHKFLAL